MRSGDSSFWRLALKIVCCLGLTLLILMPAAAQEPAPPADQEEETGEEPQEKVTEEITVTARCARRRSRTCRSRWRRRARSSCASAAPNHRGHRATTSGLHRAEPRPRPEPGRDARRLRRPDRARPAGRQGAGRRLPRRIGISLSLFTPDLDLFDTVARRGAARPAGHPLRLRLALRHGALHHQPARARRARDRSASSSVNSISGGELRRQRQGRRSTCRSATPRRCASPPTTTSFGGYIDARAAGAASRRTSTTATAPAPALALRIEPNDSCHHHAARGLPASGHGRLEPRRRLQHPRQPVHHHAAGGARWASASSSPSSRSSSPTSSCSPTSTSSSTSAIWR